jgi:hypothetical protein
MVAMSKSWATLKIHTTFLTNGILLSCLHQTHYKQLCTKIKILDIFERKNVFENYFAQLKTANLLGL